MVQHPVWQHMTTPLPNAMTGCCAVPRTPVMCSALQPVDVRARLMQALVAMLPALYDISGRAVSEDDVTPGQQLEHVLAAADVSFSRQYMRLVLGDVERVLAGMEAGM